MLSYLVRRILLLIPTMIGATALIFFVMELAPVSPVDVLLSREGTMRAGEREAREDYLNERYGLNKPAHLRYLRWLNNISPIGFQIWRRDDPQVLEKRDERTRLREARRQELLAALTPVDQVEKEVREIELSPAPGEVRSWVPRFKWPDLGSSFKQSRPVGPVILEALPITLLLQSLSVPLAYAIAITSGIWTAKHRGKAQDVATGTILLALWSLPVIWVSVMLIGFFANSRYGPLQWFPAAGMHDVRAGNWSFFPSNGNPGYFLDMAWHLVLPLVALTYGSFAYLSKLTRTSLLDTLGADFVRTARAKGLRENVVLFRHAFRNSLLPLITIAASLLPVLISGSVVVETVFSIPGMGRLAIDSVKSQDYELFLSVSTILLLLQLVGFLLADVAYVIADPRVSYER